MNRCRNCIWCSTRRQEASLTPAWLFDWDEAVREAAKQLGYHCWKAATSVSSFRPFILFSSHIFVCKPLGDTPQSLPHHRLPRFQCSLLLLTRISCNLRYRTRRTQRLFRRRSPTQLRLTKKILVHRRASLALAYPVSSRPSSLTSWSSTKASGGRSL